MADGDKGGPPLPPKLDLRKSGVLKPPPSAPLNEPAPAGEDLETEAPTMPGAVAPPPPAAAPAPAPELKSKKKTTRIPLDVAKPLQEAQASGDGPKTIRIKPAAVPAASKIRIDGETEASEKTRLAAEKRKTSRISLEAVLGGEGAEEGKSSGPKTIRLKRPGDTGATKVSAAAPETVKVSRGGEAAAAAGEEPTSEAPTVRKTVRVRRPSGPAGRPSVSVSRPAGQQAAAAGQAPQLTPVEMPKGDRVNFMFPFLTLAAVLILCVMIYMFCSQAFGPNFSLTSYSYANTGPELPWPGKLLATR